MTNPLVHPIGHPMPPTPSAEHLVTHNNLVTLSPTIPVSFVSTGRDSDGHQNPSLATGPSDGFEKTIAYAEAAPGNTFRLPFYPSGLQIDDSGGSATLRWNAQTSSWWITGGVNIIPVPPLPLS
jgi:hypothetical protein